MAVKTDASKRALCSISCTLKNVILSLRTVIFQVVFGFPAELHRIENALNDQELLLDQDIAAMISDQMDESLRPKPRNKRAALPLLPLAIPAVPLGALAAGGAAAAGAAGAAAAATAAGLAGATALGGATLIGAPIAAEVLKHTLPVVNNVVERGADFAEDLADNVLNGIDNFADDFLSGW